MKRYVTPRWPRLRAPDQERTPGTRAGMLRRAGMRGREPRQSRRRMPEAPQGVVLRYPDGSIVPCELTYEGVDDEGLHAWVVVNARWTTPAAQLMCSVLPGRTRIRIEMTDGEAP